MYLKYFRVAFKETYISILMISVIHCGTAATFNKRFCNLLIVMGKTVLRLPHNHQEVQNTDREEVILHTCDCWDIIPYHEAVMLCRNSKNFETLKYQNSFFASGMQVGKVSIFLFKKLLFFVFKNLLICNDLSILPFHLQRFRKPMVAPGITP